jgi:hypothetical protein
VREPAVFVRLSYLTAAAFVLLALAAALAAEGLK